LRGLGKVLRRGPVQRAVGTHGVVVDAPGFDRHRRIGQTDKPVFVQTFIAKLAVEALDVRVLDWLARPNEGQRDAAGVGPRIERGAGKLRPIVPSEYEVKA